MKDNILHSHLKKENINNTLINEKSLQKINNINSSNISIYSDDSTSEIKLCDTPFIYHKEKYLVDSDQNKIISFYSTFKSLKEKFGLKNKRKNRIDCIIKRVKTKYLKAIHESIKYCVNINIDNLPQYFIANIKIEYNKIYFNKTIEQIYTEFKILPSLDELTEKNLIKKGKKEFLIVLMKSSLKDIYKSYLSSELYKYYRMYIKKKEGEKVAKLYDYIAQNICQYFLYNKGNKKKIDINNNKESIYDNLNEKKLINNDKIIIEKNVNINNNLSTYDCIDNEKDNKVKFLILKVK